MKKMFLLTLALLAFCASFASAQGTINLAYTECRTAGNTGNAAQNDFVPALPCNVNDFGIISMAASFKNSAPFVSFSATGIKMDIVTVTPTLPDFWNFDPGTCHEGALFTAGSFGTGGTNPTAPVNCTNPFGAASGQYNNSGSLNTGPNRVHYEADHGKNTPTASLAVPVSAGGYVANVISIGWDNVNADGAGCAGCDVAACLLLTSVAMSSSTGATELTSPEHRNWVTFNGGGGTCPGATPTKNATWGQVKALYR